MTVLKNISVRIARLLQFSRSFWKTSGDSADTLQFLQGPLRQHMTSDIVHEQNSSLYHRQRFPELSFLYQFQDHPLVHPIFLPRTIEYLENIIGKLVYRLITVRIIKNDSTRPNSPLPSTTDAQEICIALTARNHVHGLHDGHGYWQWGFKFFMNVGGGTKWTIKPRRGTRGFQHF